MSVRIESSSEVVTAFLEGELDHHRAKDIREQIDAHIEEHSPRLLILDFADVSFMDSSGIGLVMGRYRQMKLLDGEVKVQNASPQITKVMRMAGLERLKVLEGEQRK